MKIISQLAELETAQLVRRVDDGEPTYAFRHALTQEAAYESLLHTDRRAMHHHVAQAYEALYGNRCLDDYAAILAQHYAAAGDDGQTLVYAMRAGDVAARLYANAEAIAFYSQALEAAKRGNATTAQFVHLYTKRGRVFEVTGRDPEALSTYEEMTEFSRARDDRALELQSLLLQGKLRSVLSVAFDRAKALALADEANVLARELGDRKAQAQSLWNQLLVYLYNSELPDAIRCGEQAWVLACELDARELQGYILTDLARAYLQSGQVSKMVPLQAQARAIWRELDNKPMLADNLMQSATLAMLHGDYDATIALAEEGTEISKTIDSKVSLLSNQGTLLFPYLDRGELDHALQLANDIVRVSMEVRLNFNPPMAYAFAALTFGFVGAFERGEEMAQRVREIVSQPLPEFFRAWAWVLLARYYLVVGNVSAALTALSASQMENHAGHVDPASLFGVIAQGECLLARHEYERAVQLMANRVTMLRQLGFRQSLHDALFIQAKAMRALGETDHAFELLNEARTEAERIPSRRLLWQIYTTLSEMESERGNMAHAENYRTHARATIGHIVEHTPPNLRASFLNRHDVRAVMKSR